MNNEFSDSPEDPECLRNPKSCQMSEDPENLEILSIFKMLATSIMNFPTILKISDIIKFLKPSRFQRYLTSLGLKVFENP